MTDKEIEEINEGLAKRFKHPPPFAAPILRDWLTRLRNNLKPLCDASGC